MKKIAAIAAGFLLLLNGTAAMAALPEIERPSWFLDSFEEYSTYAGQTVRGIMTPVADFAAITRPLNVFWREHKKPEGEPHMTFVWLQKDWGDFGYYADLRHWHDTLGDIGKELWAQELYGYWDSPYGRLKAGIIRTPIGVPWDNTIYGPIPYFKGYLSDSDVGVTLDNSFKINEGWEIKTTAGYFIQDDGVNGTTVLGFGTEFRGAGEENTFAGRVESVHTLAPDMHLSVGASALDGELRAQPAKRQAALEADSTFSWGPLSLTGEGIYYDQNFESRDSTARGWTVLGMARFTLYDHERKLWPSRMEPWIGNIAPWLHEVTLNYSHSKDLADEGAGLGQLRIPSVAVQISDHLRAELALVDWKNREVTVERTWYLVFSISL